MSLFFISGPHGAGKTTLVKKLQEACPEILVPELKTKTPVFHTSPLERITMKICQRSIENFEALEIAENSPGRIVLANRCIYDALAYAEAYFSLGWINEKQLEDQKNYALFAFPEKVRSPNAIVLNPPFSTVKDRLGKRWQSEPKKWNEDNVDYCRAACSAYAEYKGHRNIIYLKESDNIEKIVSLLKSRAPNPLLLVDNIA